MLMGRAAYLGTDLESANPYTDLKQSHKRKYGRDWFEDSFLKRVHLKGFKQLQ